MAVAVALAVAVAGVPCHLHYINLTKAPSICLKQSLETVRKWVIDPVFAETLDLPY